MTRVGVEQIGIGNDRMHWSGGGSIINTDVVVIFTSVKTIIKITATTTTTATESTTLSCTTMKS